MSFYRNKRKDKVDDFIHDESEDEESESSEEEKSARNKKTASKKSRTGKAEEKIVKAEGKIVKAEEKIDPETGILVCKISKDRRVVVRMFRKAILIDIRQYYGKEEDEMKPSKKGISLSLDQWKVLVQNADRIDEAIQEMS